MLNKLIIICYYSQKQFLVKGAHAFALLRPLFTISCSLLLVLSSCNKVEPPFVNKTASSITDSTTFQRTVLLEEITGDQCKNCPSAHAKLEYLQKLYGSRLVSYAVIAPKSSGVSDDSLLSSTSNDIYNKWISLTGLPTGMINRKSFPPPISGITVSYDDWQQTVRSILQIPPQLNIILINNYNITSRNLNTSVYILTVDTISVPLMLSVYIIEDSLRNSQTDDSTTVSNYIERNVLRGSMNGTWGDALQNKALPKNQYINKNYQCPLKRFWNYKQVYTVAFVYNENNYEVIQSQKAKITP